MFSKSLEGGVKSEVGMKTPEVGENIEKNVPTSGEFKNSDVDNYEKQDESYEQKLNGNQFVDRVLYSNFEDAALSPEDKRQLDILLPKIRENLNNYTELDPKNELYQKYQKDYQVDEILHGVIREAACRKLEKAPFDERLSVISLLTAKLNDGFLALSMMEDRLERLQKLLGGVKPGNYDEQEYPSALERLEGILAGVQAEWKYKKEAGLLDRKEAHLTFDTVETLDALVKELRSEHITETDAVWEKVSQAFADKNDQYEVQFDLCGEQLEHAFDFMEAAFGQSQEMVVFITSLNMGFYSVRFLGEYECERYYRYNQTLLFDGQEKEILEKIEKQ